MKDFIYQIDKNECGFASLKMLLAHLYHNEALLYIKHQYPENHAYSLLEIKEIGKEYGLLLGGYLIYDIDDALDNDNPFIFIRTLANGNKHAVLVKKINQIFALIYDPDIGKKIVLTKRYFFDIKEGAEILVVENFVKIAINFKIYPLISIGQKIKISLIQITSIISYFLGACFMNENSHFLYPVILVSIGSLFSILEKISLYHLMETFDSQYIKLTYHQNLKIRDQNYRLMHYVKTSVLTTNNEIIINLTSALAVNTILILNNYQSVFVIITACILVLFESILFSPKLKKMMYELETQESHFLHQKNVNENEYENEYQKIKENTYRISRLFDIKKIIGFFILLMVVIFMSGISENANVNFVIFYLMTSIFTYTSLDRINSILENNRKNVVNQTKFYELINEKKNQNNRMKL